MPGLYTITTRADGTTLTAAIYNSDHQNHVDNHTPDKMDDLSSNVAAMQITSDPGEVGTESLPTSLDGEIKRLRHLIKEIVGNAEWYESPSQGLEALIASIASLGTAATKDTGTSSGTIPVISTTSVNLAGSGSISSGTLYCYKVGNLVVLTWDNLAHSSNNTASTASGAVPSGYRPTAQITNVYWADITAVRNVTVTAAGLMTFTYHSWDGLATNKTSTGGASIAFYKY